MDGVKNYKCPSCGAPLIFDGKSQNLHCESCGNNFSVETMEQLDGAESEASKQSKYDWESYEPRSFNGDENVDFSSYSCPSCGAEIVGDDTMGATVCPYCGNATIIKGQFEGTMRPDYLIPFRIDKKSAVKLFEEACKKAPFLPDEFKDKKKIEEMSGLYVPFWMFDCDCSASVTYDAKIIRTWSDSNYNYTRTDFYRLLRTGDIDFANIPVDASQKAEDNFMDAVEPFDYNDAVEFNSAYLSGYFADKYDVSVDDCIERANRRIKRSVEQAFERTVGGYVNVVPVSSSIRSSNGKIRYSLLPVWMLNIKYEGQMYKYAINGQTGKVVGDYPVCKRKRRKYFIIRYIISLIIAAIVYYIFWGRLL